MQVDYSVVVATRNRAHALQASLPVLLNQSRPPRQLIVVDSSDDHSTVASIVETICADSIPEFLIIRSEPGLPRQRNAGLDRVLHPVVFFPDDDSIFFPGCSESILAAYEADHDKRIAAVCAAESKSPPPDFLPNKSGYKMRFSDRLKQQVGYFRSKSENRFVPDPAKLVGRNFYSSVPSGTCSENTNPVEWMTGFRMTFRTEVIKKVRFDEIFEGYALFEDIDASFGAWKHGAVIASRSARIFHYKSPERRSNGWKLGFTQIFNKAYVILKHTDPKDPARKAMINFSRYKLLQYFLGRADDFGKDRYLGAKEAYFNLREFLACSHSELPAFYQSTMDLLSTRNRA